MELKNWTYTLYHTADDVAQNEMDRLVTWASSDLAHKLFINHDCGGDAG